VKGYNIFISNIVNDWAMDENRTVAYIAVILVITLLVFPKLTAVSNVASKFFAQAATSKNSTALSAAGNTTMTPSMANATSEAQKQNNVTTAAGNNGHIYRGGAATGSGGE
jgi:ABC-type phosphate transport system substrate-binding protein